MIEILLRPVVNKCINCIVDALRKQLIGELFEFNYKFLKENYKDLHPLYLARKAKEEAKMLRLKEKRERKNRNRRNKKNRIKKYKNKLHR